MPFTWAAISADLWQPLLPPGLAALLQNLLYVVCLTVPVWNIATFPVSCSPFYDKAMAAANMLGHSPHRPAWFPCFGDYSMQSKSLRMCMVCFAR